MFFDPMYCLFILPGLELSLWASARVKRTFNRYSKVWSRRGSTGAQAAVALLRGAGITDVQIVRAHGVLSDHYNPVTKKLVLSEPVHASDSIAAVGMATHEAGHAIQHARHYAPLWVRSALVPTASIGSESRLWCHGHRPVSGLDEPGTGRSGAVLRRVAVPGRDAACGVQRLEPREGVDRGARDYHGAGAGGEWTGC